MANDKPSAHLLLDILRNEYETDLTNLSDLYNRTGIILALIAAYLGYVLTNDNLFLIISNTTNNFFVCVISKFIFILSIVVVILIILSGNYMIKTLVTEKFIRLDFTAGFNNEVAEKKKPKFRFFLWLHIKKFYRKTNQLLKIKWNYLTKGFNLWNYQF